MIIEQAKKELEKLGYYGTVAQGEISYNKGLPQKYISITFLKKGNSKLIKGIENAGWKKYAEYKTFGSSMYSGYSMTVEYRKPID